MSRCTPSTVRPNTTPVVQVAPDVIAGAENPDTHTLEAVQVGLIEGDHVGFHWQSGSRVGEGEIVLLADLHLWKLTPSLAAKSRRYRRHIRDRDSRPAVRCPACPKGMDNTAWLVMHNCD